MGSDEAEERFEVVAVRLARDHYRLALNSDGDGDDIVAQSLRPWLRTKVDGLPVIWTATTRRIECTEAALLFLQSHLDAQCTGPAIPCAARGRHAECAGAMHRSA